MGYPSSLLAPWPWQLAEISWTCLGSAWGAIVFYRVHHDDPGLEHLVQELCPAQRADVPVNRTQEYCRSSRWLMCKITGDVVILYCLQPTTDVGRVANAAG
ncbi:hypothetical protein F4809DRAFT_637030 [Biscogniauxia mediterranea]|nr:hypothetical protein F4809DRAFT_637030 [Biscogniauxia mediterranea]